MTTPRALVLRAAGSNCDEETAYAFTTCGARSDVLPLLPFLENPSVLADYQILAIPGGFAYGDDIAAGRVLALEIVHRAGDHVLELVERGGLVLGICNGFQVLVQMGLLPGLDQPIGEREFALTDNESNVYQDRWVHLRAETDRCPFLRQGERYYVPVAHAEGRIVADDAVLGRARSEDRIALRYVEADGSDQPSFPSNPNGSMDAIAGLTDRTGRILGLMPHPERHFFPFQHPTWTREGLAELPDGRRMFENAVAALR